MSEYHLLELGDARNIPHHDGGDARLEICAPPEKVIE